MDKSKEYRLYWIEEDNRWVCESDDLQQVGSAYEANIIKEDDRDLVAALAVADLAGYDIGIIQEELGMEREF